MTAPPGARHDAMVQECAARRAGAPRSGGNALRGWGCRLGALLLLGSAWLLRAPLEASMLLHMALQLPMIVVAGALWASANGRPGRLGGVDEPGAGDGCWARCDAHGLAGLTWLLLASAYWMVPRALEQALTMPLAEAGKFASLFALGLMLPGALRRANTVIQLFFLGNFSAMMAIAGMLYQDLPQRLCNAYSLDDQFVTGTGLVIGAVGIAIAWCLWQMPAISGYAGTERRSAR